MLRERYVQHVQYNAPSFYNPYYRIYTLKERIDRHFGDKIMLWRPNNKSELLYSAEVETGVAVEAAFGAATSEAKILNDASVLHRTIMDAHHYSTDILFATFLNLLTVPPLLH